MSKTTSRSLVIAAALAVLAVQAPRDAKALPPSKVPPTMEIEVLDPGVDPEGKPAVRIERGPNGERVVEIPPTVLVHRYYYTGDRSFQAQMLRGGPVIIVLNHPKTGERTYVEANLPPGAPRVTYRQNKVIYDYDHHAAILQFGLLGKVTVTYRSGRTWSQTATRALHLETIHDHSKKMAVSTKQCASRVCTTAGGVAVVAKDTAKGVVTPVVKLGAALPLVSTVFGGGFEQRMAERLATSRRDAQVKAAQRSEERAEWTIPTNIR